jgi:fumarylacetoacetase
VINEKLKSWIDVPADSDFPIQNIPFGVVKLQNGSSRCATRIGNQVIDLYALAQKGYFDDLGIPDKKVFKASSLNGFISLGKGIHRGVRQRISILFEKENMEIQQNDRKKAEILYHLSDVEMQLPVKIGDYTDFYSSKEHAINVGMMFRDPQKPLLPNWCHLPVAYHGRSSSIVPSGARIHRPKGQTKSDGEKKPVFGPTKALDFELEMAFIIGQETRLGESVSTEEAEDYIFGLVLFNDLSARDIQKWEYVPLGPFLGKNFGSVISPWIVTLDALEPFRTKGPAQDPTVLPYLQFKGMKNFNIYLEVFLQADGSVPDRVCHSNFKFLYWNMAQQLAHHTVSGCNVNIGDMMASGTISGPKPESYGSMLEITRNGTRPLVLSNGSERKFLEDMDTVIMRGYGKRKGLRIGFGDCAVQISPGI